MVALRALSNAAGGWAIHADNQSFGILGNSKKNY
jgi:hypothetical protein